MIIYIFSINFGCQIGLPQVDFALWLNIAENSIDLVIADLGFNLTIIPSIIVNKTKRSQHQ